MKRLMYVLAALFIAVSCDEIPETPTDEPTPPVEETIPAGKDGSVEFEISNENGGDSGESTADPAVATTSEPLEMT